MLAGLAGGDLDEARVWVHEVLGPLASPGAGDERLRETLRVFLRAGSSFKASAGELHLHFNSVKYRVARAVERRGRPIADDRLDVEVALLLEYVCPPAARLTSRKRKSSSHLPSCNLDAVRQQLKDDVNLSQVQFDSLKARSRSA